MKRFATIVLIVLMLLPAALVSAQDVPVESPTEELTATPTATVFFLPTATPVGDWVDAVSATGAYVRAGPGLRFPVVTSLPNGTVVEPVGRDQEKGWILLRVGDGFGWLLRPLVRWVTDLDSLPILYIGALTPSPTFTSSPTATATATSTQTETSTSTATWTQTFTPTATASPTVTFTLFPSNTPLPTLTLTPSPSATFTDTAVPTATLVPTETFTPTNTATDRPTDVPTNTATIVPTDVPPTLTLTPLPTHTATVVPTEIPPTPTATSSPTNTAPAVPTDVPPTPTDTSSVVPTELPPTLTYTATSTNTAIVIVDPTTEVSWATALLLATAAPTDVPVVLSVATEPPTLPPTDMPSPTMVVPTDTIAPVASETPTTQPSAVPTETATTEPLPTVQVDPIIVAAEPTVTPPTSLTPENPPSGETTLIDKNAVSELSIPGEAIVAGVILLIVAGYIVSYWRGASAVDRYADGFVVDDCPVCKRGELHVETHVGRVLGVPQPRSVVTCNNCRSVLRQVGRRRWRYAVDRAANPMLYGQFNGRVVDEEKLVNLSVWNQTLEKPPTFEDDSS